MLTIFDNIRKYVDIENEEQLDDLRKLIGDHEFRQIMYKICTKYSLIATTFYIETENNNPIESTWILTIKLLNSFYHFKPISIYDTTLKYDEIGDIYAYEQVDIKKNFVLDDTDIEKLYELLTTLKIYIICGIQPINYWNINQITKITHINNSSCGSFTRAYTLDYSGYMYN